ncbi:MAG: extracellular solute-binding protein [bacterium]|nr:extracellular solute-binding protein [bacterium]
MKNKTIIGVSVLVVLAALLAWFFGLVPTRMATEGKKELKILQWKHFVPAYDAWFDEFAKKWGEDNGVTIIVDHIDIANIVKSATAELVAGEGHDLIEFVAPPADFELGMMDLTDLNQEAEKQFGRQVSICKESSFNPTTSKFYGFCHGWVPDPGNYRKSLWTAVGKPGGPNTWEDVVVFGTKIKQDIGVGMGIGMSQEIDSNMAGRALLWAFGASVQDKDEKVVINSPETVAAIKYMIRLYKNAMTNEIFSWNAASNNQALVAARASYILNSISAYRTAQKTIKKVADDIFFTSALRGPGGKGVASAHVINVYTIPKFSKNSDTAKKFLLYLTANYDQAVYNSELYNFPAFPSTAPKLMAPGGWLDVDPFGSEPPDKLAILKNAEEWTVNIGYPGSANAAIGEVFNSFIIPNMFAHAARGEMSPEKAVIEAERLINDIFEKWRNKGLVGQKTK